MEIPKFAYDDVVHHITNGHRLIGNPTLVRFLLPIDFNDPQSYLISKGISTWLSEEHQIHHVRESQAGAHETLSSPGETLKIIRGYEYSAGAVSRIAEILNRPVEEITHGIERVVEF